jgi:hypothetical protein
MFMRLADIAIQQNRKKRGPHLLHSPGQPGIHPADKKEKPASR